MAKSTKKTDTQNSLLPPGFKEPAGYTRPEGIKLGPIELPADPKAAYWPKYADMELLEEGKVFIQGIVKKMKTIKTKSGKQTIAIVYCKKYCGFDIPGFGFKVNLPTEMNSTIESFFDDNSEDAIIGHELCIICTGRTEPNDNGNTYAELLIGLK